jgi:hypothetical protein
LLKGLDVENYTSISAWQETIVLGTSEGDIVLIDPLEWQF